MINLNKVTFICNTYGITYTQFIILYSRYTRDYTLIASYLEGRQIDGRFGFDTEEIEDLIARGFIEYWGKEDVRNKHGDQLFDMKDFMLNEDFREKIWFDYQEAGKELFDTYPMYLSNPIDKIRVPAKSCNVDKYMEMYAIKMGHDKERHDKILKAIKRATELGEIKEGIVKFIEGLPYTDARLFDLLNTVDNSGTWM